MKNRPLRIAMFLGSFPVLSETFITRQIAGLLDAEHDVRVYADCRSFDETVHPEIAKYQLLRRTTFMDMPVETAPWEMPVWPLSGRTWPPGSDRAVPNFVRVARASPKLFTCLIRRPRLTLKMLRRSEYGYQAQSLSALYRLHKLASRPAQFDVLHAHFGPVAKSFRFARTLWRAPLIVSFHGYDFCTVPRKEGPGVYDPLFPVTDLVTVNSEYTRRCVEELHCPPTKIYKLPVGLNLDQFRFQERTLQPDAPVRVLTAGRLVEIKGHEYVIQAIDIVRRKYPSICYDIVGDGPLRPKLQALIDELDLNQNVVLHGARSNPELREFMARSHIFVLASVSIEGDQEGQGLVLQEAQASGLPVIATQHGGLPEGLLPGNSGFVVPERDVEALAERLSFLIANPNTWPEMGRHGRRFVEEKYDMRELTLRLTELYAKAIADFGHFKT